MDPFILSDNDKAQGLWLRLRAYLEARLADARVRNDRYMSDYETAALRGQIQALKDIIRLGDERPIISDEEQP